MHSSPPVSNLLHELATFAERVAGVLNEDALDWQWRRSPTSWSLSEVMCHLRDVEMEAHLPRYTAVITRDTPFLSGIDSDDWAATRAYHAQNGREAAITFLALRRQSLELLQDLPPEAWERTATHAFFGTTTLHELVSLAVQHDEAHWQQIQELLEGPGKSPTDATQ